MGPLQRAGAALLRLDVLLGRFAVRIYPQQQRLHLPSSLRQTSSMPLQHLQLRDRPIVASHLLKQAADELVQFVM